MQKILFHDYLFHVQLFGVASLLVGMFRPKLTVLKRDYILGGTVSKTGTQRLQYPSIREYSLKYTVVPYLLL